MLHFIHYTLHYILPIKFYCYAQMCSSIRAPFLSIYLPGAFHVVVCCSFLAVIFRSLHFFFVIYGTYPSGVILNSIQQCNAIRLRYDSDAIPFCTPNANEIENQSGCLTHPWHSIVQYICAVK